MKISRNPFCNSRHLLPGAVLLVCLNSIGATTARPGVKTPVTNPPPHWWNAAVDHALARAAPNRQQIVSSLRSVPINQREGLVFLLQNMPDADLKSLSSRFLLENIALAYTAFEQAPWKGNIPHEVFLNDVLPYASLNEARDDSRRALQEKALPLIAGCSTPSQAAGMLNQKLFPLLKVRYSTERERPDQSPTQSIASGKASCSGLAVLLVDACRAVGVPARVAGTPLWSDGRGNHTWVEIWDNGWHFTGAAEPDPAGLDHSWFIHEASEARRSDPVHAIYASSFRRTGLTFPLVWAPDIAWVNAVNVTDRYAAATNDASAATTRVLIRVLDLQGKRVAARVVIQDPAAGKLSFQGVSKDETADLNDLLAFDAAQNHDYRIAVVTGGKVIGGAFKTGGDKEQNITIDLRRIAAAPAAPPAPFYIPAPLPPIKPLAPATNAKVRKALSDYFSAGEKAQAAWTFGSELDGLLLQNERVVRSAAWDAYKAAIHTDLKADFDKKQVQFDKYLSPYTLKTVGKRPAGGWPLVIAMHGGGGAPKELNDSQWQMMQIYYNDHPELGGYQYLALRAPNDTWNGFYDDYVYPLVANLIRQQLLYNDVDPNKVFLIGYSHGGYGAFAIGPKMPDRFAAVHASASAPTDGETSAKTLRNTPFTVMVGDQDTMYGRLDRDKKFAAQIDALRGARKDIYPVIVDVKAGYGHGGLPDRDELIQMYSETRNPVPRDLTWEMTDTVITDFYWLHSTAPGKNREIDATCHDNHIIVTTTQNVTDTSVLLDSRLVDFDRPLIVEVNGHSSEHTLKPSLKTLCETLLRRGDPDLAFSAEVKLANGGK